MYKMDVFDGYFHFAYHSIMDELFVKPASGLIINTTSYLQSG
jgi:hypothetical protein